MTSAELITDFRQVKNAQSMPEQNVNKKI